MDIKITIEDVKKAIINDMAEYIVNLSKKNGAWVDWDDSETIKAELNDYSVSDIEVVRLYEQQNPDEDGDTVDIWETLENNGYDWFELYQEALYENAYKKFKYKIVLSETDIFGNIQSSDVWYSTDKCRLVNQVYEDCVGFEFADEKYSKNQLYSMIETL